MPPITNGKYGIPVSLIPVVPEFVDAALVVGTDVDEYLPVLDAAEAEEGHR